MPYFGRTSRKRLETCRSNLQDLFNQVIREFDCTVIEGHRLKEKQNQYYDEGRSKVQYPDGKHNSDPSDGIDVAPFINGSISWNRIHCLHFAGFVLGIAFVMGIKIRWGGDWDMDHEAVTDQEFQDLVHFELV